MPKDIEDIIEKGEAILTTESFLAESRGQNLASIYDTVVEKTQEAIESAILIAPTMFKLLEINESLPIGGSTNIFHDETPLKLSCWVSQFNAEEEVVELYITDRGTAKMNFSKERIKYGVFSRSIPFTTLPQRAAKNYVQAVKEHIDPLYSDDSSVMMRDARTMYTFQALTHITNKLIKSLATSQEHYSSFIEGIQSSTERIVSPRLELGPHE